LIIKTDCETAGCSDRGSYEPLLMPEPYDFALF